MDTSQARTLSRDKTNAVRIRSRSYTAPGQLYRYSLTGADPIALMQEVAGQATQTFDIEYVSVLTFGLMTNPACRLVVSVGTKGLWAQLPLLTEHGAVGGISVGNRD